MKTFVLDCKMLILELKWKLLTWEFADVTRFWTQTQVATRGTQLIFGFFFPVSEVAAW